MELTLYQIDAFAEKPFEGNPAAVCPLQEWLPDALMQAIANENNLSETAFFVPVGSGYHIRWFTPKHEVKLCGHATLATAFVIFDILGSEENTISFQSRSGTLTVTRDGGLLEMAFPAQPPQPCVLPDELGQAFDATVIECLKSEDYILVLENEGAVAKAAPEMSLLSRLDLRGVSITATAEDHDFVTRFFAPKYGINEDPVTGSAFTQLAPYWSARLGKDTLTARQLSARGGKVGCTCSGDKVLISGKAAKYMEGKIEFRSLDQSRSTSASESFCRDSSQSP